MPSDPSATLPESLPGMPAPLPPPPTGSAFGAENRARLLDEYFRGAGQVSASDAWAHVYRLLLWIDRTTGLAHCYESDKCQPGRPWYARSLAFHDWVAQQLGTTPSGLAEEIDGLFKAVTADLATRAAAAAQRGRVLAAEQRRPYQGRGFPEPGEDPELQALIDSALAPFMTAKPPAHVLQTLIKQIQAYAGQDNKRKNLVGEGFEDTIAALLAREPDVRARYEVRVRPALHTLPGFNPQREDEKPKKVDLALIDQLSGRRTLVSCKWSVRSDREEQFATDYEAYDRLDRGGHTFDYVLITNEFDPARLAAACTNRRHNRHLFDTVVHVNTGGPLAAYAAPANTRRKEVGGRARALALIESGRLSSLSDWLVALEGAE